MAPGFGGLSGLAGVSGGYLDAQKEIEDTELTRQRQKLAQQDIDLGPLRKKKLEQDVTQAGQQYQLGQVIDAGYGRTATELFNAPVPGAQPMTPMPGQPSQSAGPPPGMPPGAGPPGGPPMGAGAPPQPGPQPGGGPPGGMISPGGMGGGGLPGMPPGMPPGMRPGGQQPQPLTWQRIAQAAVRANPGAPPEVIGGIVGRFKNIMAGESREQWNEIRLQLEYLRGQTARDVATTRGETARDVATTRAGATTEAAGIRAGATTQAAETKAGAARDVAVTRAGAARDVAETRAGALKDTTQMKIDAARDALQTRGEQRLGEIQAKHEAVMNEIGLKGDQKAYLQSLALEKRQEFLDQVQQHQMDMKQIDATLKIMREQGLDARSAARLAVQERGQDIRAATAAAGQDVTREGQERRAATAQEAEMGRERRAGAAEAGRESRFGRHETGVQERFDVNQARLRASQEMRADKTVQQLEMQKRGLEERIRHDRSNEDFKAYGQLLDNYKTRIRATLQASNAFNMLKPAEKQALLAEMDREVEQARTRMRDFMQGKGPAPTSTPQVQPQGEQEGAAQPAPQPGDVRSGYRFKGGDPNKQESWERMQ